MNWKNFWKEFKEFAIKGNAVDLAVGVIIGAAFGSIVNSLVKDVVMPPISLLTGGLDFSNKFVLLRAAKNGSAAIKPCLKGPLKAKRAPQASHHNGRRGLVMVASVIIRVS